MKVLIAGWFSFEQMGASAGDILARDRTAKWLADAGINFDVAVEEPFEGDVRLSEVNPDEYSHFLFVCGPFGSGWPINEMMQRFAGCKWIGLNLTMLEKLDDWNPFDLLVERDSDKTKRADLVFLTEPVRVPKIGLILVHKQKEYGSRCRHEEVDQLIRSELASIDAAVVQIDTRLDHNATGLNSIGQIETMIASMDLTVTTRLHGTVLSLKNGVPPIVIDPIAGTAKVTAQCRQIGWERCIGAEECTADWLRESIAYAQTDQAAADAAACRAAAQESLRGIHTQLIEYFRSSTSTETGEPA
ncbi:MAG: polysaccharide pyruvyl transferase family protein [Phycisphaeraceae bacterium]